MKTNNKAMMIVGIPIIFVALSATILSSTYVSADNDSVVDEINITVPVSCTMTGTDMDSHSTEIQNGLYKDDIGTTTLHAFCNDNEGFAIYAAGYTGNEIGGTNSNKLVGTTASSNATIVSGIATTAGNPDVSNWAMKLAISQDSGDTTTNAFTIDSAPNVDLPSEAEQSATQASFSQYHVVPNEYTKVAHKNSGTDMTASTGGVKLTTTYAAYISKTQPADTYTGQVIYTLVHPASASAPSLDGCNPTGTTIGTNTSTDIVCMQDITSTNKTTVLASMTEGTQYSLIDKRDEKSYTIAKLADGKVWMTQNLDLDIDSSRTYTNEDTDLGWDTSTNTYQAASWTPTRSTYATTSDQTHEWCQGGTRNTQNGYCENNNTPESYDPGNLYWNGAISDGSDWRAYWITCDFSTSTPTCTGTSPLATYVATSGTPQYHLGNYYNWAAAIASNDASVYGVYNEISGEYENQETNQSICPAGWTLPYIPNDDSANDFATLWTQYGWDSNSGSFSDITNPIGAPLFFVLTGYFINGNLEYAGAGSNFWSPTADGDGLARFAAFDSFSAEPADGDNWYQGFSVRCLLR